MLRENTVVVISRISDRERLLLGLIMSNIVDGTFDSLLTQ
jgi:hypothetical protein